MNNIEEVSTKTFNEWFEMGIALWPDNNKQEFENIFKDILNSKTEKGFLYKLENEYIGFINVSLRNDYVAGSNSSPVGFVEGIYVKEKYRKKGIARLLLQKAERWAISKGCTEMGSDIEINNDINYKFHEKCDFIEVERVICFIKKIKK